MYQIIIFLITADTTAMEKDKSMCRNCHKYFIREENNPRACAHHPECYTGETAQRWMAPGDTLNASKVHNFWSCCGNSVINSPGCCFTAHVGFDEEEDVTMRRPGTGISEQSPAEEKK
jgi:hypothetical protein